MQLNHQHEWWVLVAYIFFRASEDTARWPLNRIPYMHWFKLNAWHLVSIPSSNMFYMNVPNCKSPAGWYIYIYVSKESMTSRNWAESIQAPWRPRLMHFTWSLLGKCITREIVSSPLRSSAWLLCTLLLLFNKIIQIRSLSWSQVWY